MTPQASLHAYPAFARSSAPPHLSTAFVGPVIRAEPPRGGLSRRALVRALEYMHAHLGDRFTLQDVASAAAVSRFHFARMFRVSTGHSPMEYLQELRIDTARTLLQAGGRRIVDIAATLGFCDQSHFTRTFRRATGVAPRDYAQRGPAPLPSIRMFEALAPSGRMPAAANDNTQSSAA